MLELLTQPVRVFVQQAVVGLQDPATGRFQGLGEGLPSLGLAIVCQQQFGFLGQRHHAEQLPACLLAIFEQCIQASFGLHRLALDHFQQGLLQFDMQRQLWMEFRRRSRMIAVVGLAQSRKPGFGQIGTALGQPEFAFDQRDHRQVVDRRHVPDVHQAFGFGEFGEGFGEFTAAAFEPGDHAMADQHADIATGARLGQTRE
ncbi:hypothetical protein D3C84_664440 [compost metagenome]